MTIICGMREQGATWIGSDTQWLKGGNEREDGGPKFIVRPDCAIGINGSGAYLTLLDAHANEIDSSWSGHGMFLWATEHFGQFGVKPEEKPGYPSWWDCSFIWARLASLCSICPTGGVIEHDGFFARGSGDEYALGAAHALSDMHAEQRLAAAIQAAMHYDTGCGGSVWLHRLEG